MIAIYVFPLYTSDYISDTQTTTTTTAKTILVFI